MGEIGDHIADLGEARAVADTARSLLTELRGTAFWKLPDLDLLALARELEGLRRLSWAAQIHLAGELDTRGVAEKFGATSTAGLLRQTLVISAQDATAQVNTARDVLPKDVPSGGEVAGEVAPALPLLADVLAAGEIGAEQTRTIVTIMRKLPGKLDGETRMLCQKLLVENGVITQPKPFADFARAVALSVDPDGKLDDKDPGDRVELNMGSGTPGPG